MKSGKNCPNCGRELDVKQACCEDKKRGWSVILKCSRCGYKERLV